MTTDGFRGIPPEAFDFFVRLAADNTKAFWSGNKGVYENAVRAPMEALCEALSPEFGDLNVVRPYRDVRFSKDKAPYKTYSAAGGDAGGGNGVWLSVSAEGVLMAIGMYQMSPERLDAYRRAVDDDKAGPALEAVVTRLEGQGYAIGGEALKSAPRGYPKDHPRIRLLRHRSLYTHRSLAPDDPVVRTPHLVDVVRDTWRAAAPLTTWLSANVGPL